MKKQNKKKPWVRKRHKFWFCVTKYPVLLYLKFKFHFKHKPLKFDRKQRYFILCNHQTDIDALMMYCEVGRVPYVMTTDTLLSSGFGGKFLSHGFGVIPKKKGVQDAKSLMIVLQIVKEGGDIMLFPEGNRTYAEFQYEIDPALIKLIKKCGLPIMILNIHGGTGVCPRFCNKTRKGQTSMVLKEIISKEEYEALSNEELYQRIKDGLRVYDSESNQVFKSKHRAEYLERMFFVCPVCKGTECLHSEGNYLSCSCGLRVEYTEDLHLKSDHPKFTFTRMNDWYQYQKRWMREFEPKDNEIIFQDPDVKIYTSIPYKKRKLITKGKLTVTKDELNFNDVVKIPLKELKMASPISGIKFNFSTKEDSYFVVGHERFNPLKYVFLFHRLDTGMKGNDIYYNIYDKEEEE